MKNKLKKKISLELINSEAVKKIKKFLSACNDIKMDSMAGFRNIAVHDYQAIDIEILKSILTKDLNDLEAFYTSILNHFKFTK